MDSISAVNTSFYPGLIEGFAPTTTMPVPAVDTEEAQQGGGYYYNEQQNSNAESEIDLSNYYNEVRPEDLLSKTGQSLIESAQALDNTMVIAMQNGYSVQDVCNIRLAEMAYKANAYIFDIASEISTFSIDV